MIERKRENKVEKNCLWNMIRINWKEVFVTLNGTIIQMPRSVKIPLRGKDKLRTLMEKAYTVIEWYAKRGNILVCIG